MIGYLIAGIAGLYLLNKARATTPGLTKVDPQPNFVKPKPMTIGPSVQTAQPQMEAAKVVQITKDMDWQPAVVVTPDIGTYVIPAYTAPGYMLPNGAGATNTIRQPLPPVAIDDTLIPDANPPAPSFEGGPTLAPPSAVKSVVPDNKVPLVDSLFLMSVAL